MISELAAIINQPMAISGNTVPSRLFLAPMTQLGNVAFRELLAGYGGYGLLFSEMSNARAIPNENPRVSAYFKWREAEKQALVWQLLGSDPDSMALAARRIEREGFFGVDINLGCSVATICRRSGGAALLKNPDQAIRIITAVRRSVSIPLFVKFRTGWSDSPQFAVDMARRFEDAGVDALTFHPRIAPDIRTRPPKWEYIGLVKEAVNIPVIGNGNVFSPEDCLRMFKTTNCDAVAVGRLAVAQPWLFAQWTRGFVPSTEIHREAALDLINFLTRHFDPITALRRFKKFAHYYAANFRFGHTFYSKILNVPRIDVMADTIHELFNTSPELCQHPNQNFMI